MTCPKCDSENIRAVSKIHNEDKDAEFCKGLLCGTGLCALCSSCSAVSGKAAAFLWMCESCGRKFKH